MLHERQQSGLPPFTSLALLRAEAAKAELARDFLSAAAELAGTAAGTLADAVTMYPPVPHSVPRVADVDRMQMLVESASRPALQRFLSAWLPLLHTLRASHRGVLRWAVDVDPTAI